MNYITTNIRLPEKDYLLLKEEAFKRRISFAALVRENIRKSFEIEDRAEKMMKQLDKIAGSNANKSKGVDGVTILREIRSG